MGLFDTVIAYCDLPDFPQNEERTFQTKSLRCTLDLFFITKEGRLLFQENVGFVDDRSIVKKESPIYETSYTGTIVFYTAVSDYKPGDDVGWFEYEARFINGYMEDIRRKESIDDLDDNLYDQTMKFKLSAWKRPDGADEYT